MRRYRQSGFGIINDPTLRGGKKEVESISCGHCGDHMWSDYNGGHWSKMRGNVQDNSGRDAISGRCTCCDKLICLKCVADGGRCVVVEEQVALMERRAEYSRRD